MTEAEQPHAKNSSKGPVVGGLLLMVAAVVLALWGINSRSNALAQVKKETAEMATDTVATVSAKRGQPAQEIVLPGTTQAFIDSPIYARTNGYLKRWFRDIGAHVRVGERLAEIDTPELDQQLRQARADLATAQANAKLAETTAARYRELIKTDSVSQQDLDNANGNLEAKQAAVESAGANVKRLEELQGFKNIVAPFDGVITVRNTDVGALIDSGSNAKELFHIASISKLRVFVNVPEVYAPATRTGLEADLTLSEFPDRRFTGTVARTSNAIDVASRTLLTEVDVDNPKGELLPGAFAYVHIKLANGTPSFTLPVNALMFRSEGLRVATVGSDNRVALVPITLGRDFGNEVEVIAGLKGDEQVIVNPPDSIQVGETVRVAPRSESTTGTPARGAAK